MFWNRARRSAFVTFVSFCVLLLPSAASATNVRLKTLDGSMTVTGHLQSYRDGYYVIDTKLGTFRIEIDKSICEGTACPFIMV